VNYVLRDCLKIFVLSCIARLFENICIELCYICCVVILYDNVGSKLPFIIYYV